eukprot:2019991-Amphidinium_carterae.2
MIIFVQTISKSACLEELWIAAGGSDTCNGFETERGFCPGQLPCPVEKLDDTDQRPPQPYLINICSELPLGS